uniref:BTB domain-containing protein n=1 Tax=Panagrolaimus davidi TaxID=227884 RepID=A0A914R6X3_9BILA
MSCSKISTTEVPISVTWKIPKRELRQKYELQSEEFNVEEFPGVSYYMTFLHAKKSFGVFLCISMKEKMDMNVSYKISISSSNCVHEIFEKEFKSGHVYGMIIEDSCELFDPANNFFVNDSMIITMEAILTVQKEVPDNSVPDSEMSKTCECKLGLKLWDRDDKDFTFMVEEKEIQVHKNVISAESSVFDRMIKSGLQESKESKVAIIDFDFEIVESGLKFCYGIKDDKLYNVENGIKLLQFSDKYDIKDLKTFMETFLSSKISRMNACKLANASILGNSIVLRRKCFEYLIGCNQKKIFVADLEILDNDFKDELMKALFSRFTM